MLKRKNYTSLILFAFILAVVIGIKPLSSFAMPQLFTRVEEEDTDPSVSATKIKFPNSSETDNGDGSVSINFNIAGGWTYTDPNNVSMTDPNDVLHIGNHVTIIGNTGAIATDSTITANGAVLTGDTNTFNITSGTGSLDVAAGKTVNIDMDLTIDGTGTTITGVTQANTITLNESLTIGGGFNFTLTAEDTAGTITLDEQTFEVEGQGDNSQLTKIINVNDAAATISIEGTSAVVNQDTTSDGSPSFAKVTTTEIEFAGNITLDPAVDGASYVNIANSGTGAAKFYIEGAQVDSDDLADVASIGMLDEDETVTGAWALQYKATSAKTDNYSVTTSDLGIAFTMNASVAKTFTLPSVGASEDGALAGPFTNIGAGRMIIDASDSDYVHDSGAGDTMYTDDGDTRPYPTIQFQYIHAVTTWIAVYMSPGSTFITTE